MSGPTSSRWRLLRSAAFAAVATQLAALGHMVGGGGRPDLAVLLIGSVTIGATVTGLARRRRTWPAIFGLLAGCQVAFHLLFSVDMHAMSGAHSFLPADPLRMLAFHLIAAALSAWVLAGGEAALFRLFALLRRSVLVGPAPLPIDLPPEWTASFRGFRPPRPTGALLSTSPRRGPPAGR